MATKLAESYVEFFAKGLKEVESATQNLTDSSRKAHETVNVLSEQENLLSKTTEKVIKNLEKKSRALTSASVATKQQVKDAAALETAEKKTATKVPKKQKVEVDTKTAATALNALIAKGAGLGVAMAAGVAVAMGALKTLGKKAEGLGKVKQEVIIDTGKAEAALIAFEGKNAGRGKVKQEFMPQEKVIAKEPKPKEKAAITVDKKQILLPDTTKAESTIGGLWKRVTGIFGKKQDVGVDTKKANATLTALEKKAEILQNKKQILLIETKRAEATLAAFKAKHKGRIINFLLMINTKKAEATLERIIKKNDGKVINQSVTIDTKKADKALDAFEKKNSVLNDIKQTLVIDTTKAAATLSAFEGKHDEREIKKGVAPPKGKAAATVAAIKEKVMPQKKAVAKIAAPEVVKQKIDIDTTKAESSISKLQGKIKGLQLAAVAAAAGMAVMAQRFASAAMENTVEADRLSKAYTYAGKVIGDMFAPYVRLATEAINKFTEYWKSLSEGLKSSIAMWAAITIGVAAFVAVLPVISSILGAILSGFMVLLTPIGAVGAAIGAVIVWLSGAAKAGMTWEQRLKAAIRGVLDIWTAMQTAFEMFGDVFSGIFGAIYDTAKGVLVWIAEQFGFVGMEGMAAGDDMSTGLGSSLVWIMEKFGEFKSYVLAIFQVIQKSWASMVDGLSTGLSWVLEKLAIVGEGTTDTLLATNKEQMAQMGTDQKAAMEKLAADNKAILDKMRARMAGNKAKADEYADPLIKLFKGLDAGGGFKIKGTVAFEGLQGTFDRLQLAFANAGGPNIEQAQLIEMKGINQNMQLATIALNEIRDKGPVVR